MDILDNEASEDEAARKSGPLDRLPSHEANMKLVEKQKRYRHLLITAGESDELVRQKWDEWEQNIVALTSSEVRCSSFILSHAKSRRKIWKHPYRHRRSAPRHRLRQRGRRRKHAHAHCVSS